jgi:hypothetical protein
MFELNGEAQVMGMEAESNIDFAAIALLGELQLAMIGGGAGGNVALE